MSESLGSVRTVLAFNAAGRAAEEYDEVRSVMRPMPHLPACHRVRPVGFEARHSNNGFLFYWHWC